MTSAVYQTGDTIRLTASFYTFAGVLADLSAVPSVKLWKDDKITQVGTTGTATHDSTGVYHYDLTLPTIEGTYYVEFSGTGADSTAISRRQALIVRFSSMS